jgi:hypothetical protein
MAAQAPYEGHGGRVPPEGGLVGLHDGRRVPGRARRERQRVVRALLPGIVEEAVRSLVHHRLAVAPGEADEVHGVARADASGALPQVHQALEATPANTPGPASPRCPGCAASRRRRRAAAASLRAAAPARETANTVVGLLSLSPVIVDVGEAIFTRLMAAMRKPHTSLYT